MRINFKYITLFFALGLLWACQNKSEKQSEITIPTATVISPSIEVDMTNSNKIAESLLELIEKDKKTELIGQSIAVISNLETGAKTDSSDNFQTYSHQFNDSATEFVDVQYHHDGNTITNLALDVFVDNAGSVKSIYESTAKIFEQKFGFSSVENGAKVYKNANGSKVSLKDVSVPNSSGLQILIYK